MIGRSLPRLPGWVAPSVPSVPNWYKCEQRDKDPIQLNSTEVGTNLRYLPNVPRCLVGTYRLPSPASDRSGEDSLSGAFLAE